MKENDPIPTEELAEQPMETLPSATEESAPVLICPEETEDSCLCELVPQEPMPEISDTSRMSDEYREWLARMDN